MVNELGAFIDPPEAGISVITYLSCQESLRRVNRKDHEELILALQTLEDEGICEIYVVDGGKVYKL